MKHAAATLIEIDGATTRRYADRNPDRRHGAQAVERALSLLLRLAADDGAGQRLTDIAHRTGLDAATARRLLSTLIRHGFVEQDPLSRRYFLGLEFFTLAAAASNRRSIGTTAREVLERLRDETGATAAFCLRSDHDVVCIDVARHAADVERGRLDLGWRSPIGAGAFGLAVLAALPDEEAESIAIANVRRLSGLPEDAIRQMRREWISTRRNGYALVHDPATGGCELAIAILNRQGVPEGALGLSIAAANDNRQVEKYVRCIGLHIRAIEQVVWQLPPAGISQCETGC